MKNFYGEVFRGRGMHYSVKPFGSTDANSKGDARHSSHSRLGRVDMGCVFSSRQEGSTTS